MTTIAICGLGTMGTRIAQSLAEHGNHIVVWTRDTERAAALAAEHHWRTETTPAGVASGADVVFACVTTDEASQSLWTGPRGALSGARAGTLCIDSSTISPQWAGEFIAATSAVGMRGVHAPMIGSKPQADARQLVFLLGGDVDGCDHTAALLQPMCASTRVVGTAYDASMLKLITNVMLAIQAVMLGDVRALAGRFDAGIGAIEALSDLPAWSPNSRTMLGRMNSPGAGTNFAAELLAKDLRYALEASGANGSKLSLVPETLRRYNEIVAEGLGAEDFTIIGTSASQRQSPPRRR